MSFGDGFKRVTIVTDPMRRHWGMTRGRSCSAFINEYEVVWLGKTNPADIQADFDLIFSALTDDAPASATQWGNADAQQTPRLCPTWLPSLAPGGRTAEHIPGVRSH